MVVLNIHSFDTGLDVCWRTPDLLVVNFDIMSILVEIINIFVPRVDTSAVHP